VNLWFFIAAEHPGFRMAPEARVLKIPRSDETSGYVLVNAVSRGSKPLDLKLEATEGEEEYGHARTYEAMTLPRRDLGLSKCTCTNADAVRHDKVGSLRIKNCPALEAEWQEILQNIFQLEPQPEIKVTATVQAGSSIALVVRKEIQGITVSNKSAHLSYALVPSSQLEATTRRDQYWYCQRSRL
jgi:hypothetical protein